MKLTILVLLFSSATFASGILKPKVLSSQGGSSRPSTKVIYGDDNRQDVYAVARADLRDVSDSTAAMIPNSSLSKTATGKFKVDADSVGVSMGLCKTERFFAQPSGAMCSAFLVGDDLIATAGHCIEEASCSQNSFVFSYKMNGEKGNPVMMPADEVYNCKKVIAREQTDKQDYALLQLDRPVRGHRVLTLAKDLAKSGDPVVVIGHPSGLPTKITDGAAVREQKGDFFVANTDTYGGNSGSAVFNSQTLEVVGILVRGETDYEYDSALGCRKSFQCANDTCRGEDITNIDWISKALAK